MVQSLHKQSSLFGLTASVFLNLQWSCNAGVTSPTGPDSLSEVDQAAAHCLKLPGKKLNLTALLYAKKFRSHGYKTGAQAAFECLTRDGLGEQDPQIGDDKSSGKTKKVWGTSYNLNNSHLETDISVENITIQCQLLLYFITQAIVFTKCPVPDDADEKVAFAKKLAKYGVSLKEYVKALNEEEIV